MKECVCVCVCVFACCVCVCVFACLGGGNLRKRKERGLLEGEKRKKQYRKLRTGDGNSQCVQSFCE